MKLSVADYLEANSIFHVGRKTGHHSFPCGLWPNPNNSMIQSRTWLSLLQHGLLSKNMIIIELESEWSKKIPQQSKNS